MMGIVFTIYKSYKDPQIKLDKQQALDEAKRKGKDDIIEEKIKWEKEASEKRFCDISEKVDRAMTLAENHTHTVDVKVDALGVEVKGMGKNIVELTTIINERIPKK